MYKNPLVARNFKDAHYGDPFVFRYMGVYYLYVSTPADQIYIRCYRSKDLVNWEFLTIAAIDPLLQASYAPEIIYAYNKFYLITSPGGQGHYIFTADKPEGPYKRLTNNIHSMIDGSFFVSGDGVLHLLRADHHGIALLDVSEDGKLSNRRNLGTYLGAWTEGPGLFYREGLYYLTYCGNNLISKGYRVAYATSKDYDKNFVPGINNPIIISTMEGYTGFGHNSNVLGPDLDSWYAIYHTMEENENGFLPRKFFVDKLHFSKTLMHLGTSDFSRSIPPRPKYETFTPIKDFILENNLLFSTTAPGVLFTFETSFRGSKTSLYLGYQNDDNYVKFNFDRNALTITTKKSGETLVRHQPLNFNFTYTHTVRVINSKDRAELLVDNAPIATFTTIPVGKIAFGDYQDLFYTAYSNHANGSSDVGAPAVIPGILNVTQTNSQNELDLCATDNMFVKKLEDDKYHYIAKENGKYGLFMYAKIDDEVKLLVNGKAVKLYKTISEYDYLSYYLGDYELEEKGVLNIKVISGNIYYKFINVSKYVPLQIQDTWQKSGKQYEPTLNRDSYYLDTLQMGDYDVSVSFKVDELHPYDVFGIILGSHQYSNKHFQARYPLLGYLAGFEGGLLIFDRFSYAKERIYDRPLEINLGIIYTLRATLNNGLARVYINDKLYIETTVSDVASVGSIGLYASLGAKVTFGPLINNKILRKEVL